MINNVMIPDGKSEDEIWQIFNKIFEQIGEDDEIILDITHSFRFLPMLTFIVLNYARFMKHCSIRDVYYGLVPQKEGEHTPILVLTPFVTLFDWTIGLERYLSAGDASWVHELTYSEASRMNKEINRSESSVRASDRSLLFRDPKLLRKLADAMLEFSNIMWTCRGQKSQQLQRLKLTLILFWKCSTKDQAVVTAGGTAWNLFGSAPKTKYAT